MTLNRFINMAVAEKISVMRTRRLFAERAACADMAGAVGVLERAGKGNPPMVGDELPD
ncbi:MAG: toxin-antitoxin system HicB family antitoxin [Alphaproteobacteria bacterium]|nr:toxin-antitoxin system HicB family antitoxin [Alphaproteobacteria bacterium]